jgi:hypothetical protein
MLAYALIEHLVYCMLYARRLSFLYCFITGGSRSYRVTTHLEWIPSRTHNLHESWIKASLTQGFPRTSEQIQFGRVVIPNLTLPGNPGSNLILVTKIEIQFVFPDESRRLPRIQLRGNTIFLRQLSVASFAIDHPSRRGQTFSRTSVQC